jgi:hypothetical protein
VKNPENTGFLRECRVPSHDRGHWLEPSIAHSTFLLVRGGFVPDRPPHSACAALCTAALRLQTDHKRLFGRPSFGWCARGPTVVQGSSPSRPIFLGNPRAVVQTLLGAGMGCLAGWSPGPSHPLIAGDDVSAGQSLFWATNRSRTESRSFEPLPPSPSYLVPPDPLGRPLAVGP